MTARNHYVQFEKSDARKSRIERADAEYQQIAGELSQMLLARALRQFDKRRLLIVSDGLLQYLSCASFPLPGNMTAVTASDYVPLISKYEIVNLPSASVLSVLRTELAGRKPAPKTIAVLADPVFDKRDGRVRVPSGMTRVAHVVNQDPLTPDGETDSDLTRAFRDVDLGDNPSAPQFPRLPFTRTEAEAVARMAPPSERREALDFAANRKTAVDPQLSQFRYLHFATHALMNNSHPELSGIVLSLVDEKGNAQNGFLLTNDIYNLNLPAEVVVLSGCRTGLGKQVRGEGMMNLTRSFMYAGAARVLVSLWDINDRSTAELMTHFYGGILGKDRLTSAAALRKAQMEMWKSPRWHASYYWGAFVMQGEYH
jgi:CHAT domain-containing protein